MWNSHHLMGDYHIRRPRSMWSASPASLVQLPLIPFSYTATVEPLSGDLPKCSKKTSKYKVWWDIGWEKGDTNRVAQTVLKSSIPVDVLWKGEHGHGQDVSGFITDSTLCIESRICDLHWKFKPVCGREGRGGFQRSQPVMQSVARRWFGWLPGPRNHLTSSPDAISLWLIH